MIEYMRNEGKSLEATAKRHRHRDTGMGKTSNNDSREDFLVDVIMTAGELTDDGYHFKDNDLKFKKVIKHNVPYSKFKDVLLSPERWRLEKEQKERARKRFGDEYWMKHCVCVFYTTATKEEEEK